MRPSLRSSLLLFALAASACQCGPQKPPQRIGEGDPIGPVDAGDPDLHDSGPVACAEDDHEPNDSRDAAVVVTSGDTLSAHACGGNDDWFAVAAQPGCDVDAQLAEGDGSGHVGMLMFDPDGTLVGSANGFDTTQAIHVPANKDGNYAVRIRPGARDDIDYGITLTVTCAADLTCPADDAFEPDNDATQLARLTAGVTADAVMCGADEDWYLVPVTLGCIADTRVDFTSAEGDIDIEEYLGDGATRVAISNGTSDEERIQKVVTGAGMMIRVLGFAAGADFANPYRITSKETCEGQIACPTDDPFEPNDDLGGATQLFASLDEAIGVVCGNDDFYSLDLTNNCTLHATLTFTGAEGDLDLELQDDGGNQLAISQGTGDTESIDFPATGNDRVFLRVTGFSGASNTYRLHVEQSCQ